ncbi:uncharacterized protein LOC111116096 [Crassostrea virginica]
MEYELKRKKNAGEEKKTAESTFSYSTIIYSVTITILIVVILLYIVGRCSGSKGVSPGERHDNDETNDYDLDYSEERQWNITSGEETFSGTKRQRLRLRRGVNQLSIEQNSDHIPVESHSARKDVQKYNFGEASVFKKQSY